MPTIHEIVHDTIKEFCIEFLSHPYLCYTEHGLHARFYQSLYSALPEALRYINIGTLKVCVIQKEYSTAGSLGKPRRQHWDIAVIDQEQETKSYDYLKLNSVVEFGMNEAQEHIVDDIERLSHPDANMKNKFVVHLYRISGEGPNRVSKRDCSPKSKRILLIDDVGN